MNMNADRIDYYVNRFRGITPNRETITSILIELANEASPPTDTVTTMEIAIKVDTDKAQCVKIFAELIENQQELPDDMKKVLYDNLWSLYESEPVKSDTVTITKAEYDALVADAERWRYFRETASEEMCYAICGNSNPSNDELDQAIDSAKGK